jgi:replication factor A1
MAIVEQTFLPIAELSAYQNKWTIKARVTNKSALRTFKKGANEGKVMSVDLLDAEGGEIRASFFNQGVDKYGDMLEKGKCFTLSGGNVKVANRAYNNCNHRYELVFDKQALVEPAQDDASIEVVKFNFVTMKALGQRSLPCTVDLCGVITSFLPTQTVRTKEGVELLKREITIADDTATSFSVTLWGDRAKTEDRVFDGHPVVVIKLVSVKEWKDSRSGSLVQGGDLLFNSKIPEALHLQQWWSNGGSSQALVTLSVPTAGSDTRQRNATATTLGGLRIASEKLGHEPELFSVVARLALVQTTKQGASQPLHYMACAEIKEGTNNLPCNKRVSEDGFCAACNRAGKVTPKCTLRCRFIDFEDQTWLTSFHEATTRIIDMTGEEVRSMELAAAEKGEGGREELEAAIRSKYFAKPMNITVRAKMDTYNGEARANVTVVEARPVSKADHGRQMLKDISMLLANA